MKALLLVLVSLLPALLLASSSRSLRGLTSARRRLGEETEELQFREAYPDASKVEGTFRVAQYLY